jgi:hypothetical protein
MCFVLSDAGGPRVHLNDLPETAIDGKHLGAEIGVIMGMEEQVLSPSVQDASTTAVQQLPNACRSWNVHNPVREFFPVALPALRREHDRGAEIHGCGIIHMHLLRFVVALASLPLLGCASARRRTRVSASFPPPLSQLCTHALAHLGRHSDNPGRIPTTPFCPPQVLLRTTLPFKSHSAPRPPQTPAASS